MADYYCEITDLTDTVAGMLMTHFDVKRWTTSEVIIPNVTRHFHISIQDEDGVPIAETLQEKEARYWTELRAYADQVMANQRLVEQVYPTFRTRVIGVRYPEKQG